MTFDMSMLRNKHLSVLSVVLVLSAAAAQVPACPAGFSRHGSSCYFFASGPVTKTAAAATCTEYGAFLAAPQTLTEATWLGTEAGNRAEDFWISLTDVVQEGMWRFPVGRATPGYAFPWCPGEPNNGGGGGTAGDCVRIIGVPGTGNGNCPKGQWADFRCNADRDNQNRPIGFICEYNPATSSGSSSASSQIHAFDGANPTDVSCVASAWPPARISSLYTFSGADAGTSIEDGGNDMYDGGNILRLRVNGQWTAEPLMSLSSTRKYVMVVRPKALGVVMQSTTPACSRTRLPSSQPRSTRRSV